MSSTKPGVVGPTTAPKHRAATRSARRRVVIPAAAAAAIALAAPGAAYAFPNNKTVSPSNRDVLAKCILEVKSVNPLNGYATTIKLSGQAQPASASGYSDNVFTQVDCYLLPAGDTDPNDAMAEIHPNGNSATVLNTSTRVTVPFADSYTLCGRAFVKLRNGDTSYTPYLCA